MSNEENIVEEAVENKPFSIVRFIEDNSKNLMYAGIGLLIIAGGFWYYNSKYVPQKEANANSELYKAESFFMKDSFDIALNGGEDFSGLLDVAAEYGGTKAGQRAHYYAASALMKKGDYEQALEHLEDVSFDDEIVAPLAKCLLGDCKVELGDLEEGAKIYMAAAKMRDNDYTAPYALSKAARVYAELGDWEASLEALESIREDYKETQFAADIDKEIARAKVKASAE